MAFLAELKRRNIFKVALFYAVAAWVILKLGLLAMSLLGLPDGAARLIALLLSLGFPAALVFSWIYELTPDGLKLEREVDRDQSITSLTGERIDRLIDSGTRALEVGRASASGPQKY